jgi:hypothetical protein
MFGKIGARLRREDQSRCIVGREGGGAAALQRSLADYLVGSRNAQIWRSEDRRYRFDPHFLPSSQIDLNP